MDRTDILHAADAALAECAARTAALLRSQPDLAVPLGGGSHWTARDAATHLGIGADVYAEICAGTPSPFREGSMDSLAAGIDYLMADVTETDPEKLAALMLD